MTDKTDRPVEHADKAVDMLQAGLERDVGRIRTIDTVAGQIDGVGYQTRGLKIGREARPGPRPLPGAMNENDRGEVRHVHRPCEKARISNEALFLSPPVHLLTIPSARRPTSF